MNLASSSGGGGGWREVIANLTVNGGTFLTGASIGLNTNNMFNVTGLLKMTAGTIAAQLNGGLRAGTVEISGGAVNLDGGSAALSRESRLNVGSGGLTLTGGTINFNAGPTVVTSSSRGSILALGGNLISVGTNSFARLNAAVAGPKAVVDLLGAERVFNVTGSLDLGTSAAPISVINGAITKTGTGTLTLSGVNPYTGATNIDAGTLVLTGSIASSTRIEVDAGATFDVAGIPGGFTLGATQTLAGNGTVAGAVSASGAISPGTTSIGTLHFTAGLMLAGLANFEIGKTSLYSSADLADVAGNLAYGGTLNITATGDPLLAGDAFDLFDASSFSGAFTAFQLPALAPGLAWSTSDLPVNGTIRVIPEPGALVLAFSGCGLLVAVRRERRR